MTTSTTATGSPRLIAAVILGFSLASLTPGPAAAQTPPAVVPITAEPEHRIRFDNGKVRMYEVLLPKGRATLWHEHRADSFAIIIRATEFANEPYGKAPVALKLPAGVVGFASTANGPYAHRIVATGEAGFHVIAMELLEPAPAGPPSAAPPEGAPFKVTRENARGRASRLALHPGESTGAYSRPGRSAWFAISTGRITVEPDGAAPRYWDFEPGQFRWFDAGERMRLRNEGSAPVDLVQIEIF
jgi:mannose-6-phosphate isomerase-like protein (cupin superfamily)